MLAARVEAARLLGISVPTLDRMLGRGDLPVVRLGRRRLVPLAAIHQLVEGKSATRGERARGEVRP